MDKKISIKSAALIAAAASVLTFSFTSFFAFQVCNDSVAELRNKANDISRIYEVENYIDKTFYTDIDTDTIISAALKSMVSALEDPYSAYMTPEEYEQDIENAKGSISGIGITVNKNDDGTLTVIQVNEGSPAEKSGIKTDDAIIRVDGNDVTQMEYKDAVNLVRGEIGTDVSLTVRRDESEMEFTITREEINTITVMSEMLDNNIAYIRITGFKENTQTQYRKALDDCIDNGAEAIVFDLRNNGGGLVSACEACLDPLLPEGEVATAQFKDGKSEVICRSDANELDLPMAVLVNENTASAAELFSSALRDFGKAKLIGTRTFGKGIMQNTVNLENGGGLRLTVATYKTAKSECYHGVGLKPDYEIGLPEEYSKTNIEDIPHDKDIQLQKALEILK
ncbi:MAG: S41 family peptidase [Porcipelethomonas sp.]